MQGMTKFNLVNIKNIEYYFVLKINSNKTTNLFILR